jgi:hypothetical protein
MDLLTTKCVVAVLLGVSAVVVGLVPLLIARYQQKCHASRLKKVLISTYSVCRRCNIGSGQGGGKVISCLNLFGAGIQVEYITHGRMNYKDSKP